MRYTSTARMVREFLEGPLTRPALMHWRRQHFLSEGGATFYFGVFDSFASARQWLPASAGFNADALQKEYVEVRTRRIFAYDYPVMWWLSSAFRDGAQSILDIGGSVGVHYYAYLPFINMPEALSWNIVEVPSAVAIGRTLAAVRKAVALEFSQNLAESLSRAPADVLLSAGALQYLDNAGPADLIQRMAKRPSRVLLNKLPLYDGEDFVTAQNLGSGCFAPVRVFNRRNFISAIEAQGYVLKDEWSVHERDLYLPGFPERSISHFTGLYFCEEDRAGHLPAVVGNEKHQRAINHPNDRFVTKKVCCGP
jgi:putative methyltransferase (TIGR04325 family)